MNTAGALCTTLIRPRYAALFLGALPRLVTIAYSVASPRFDSLRSRLASLRLSSPRFVSLRLATFRLSWSLFASSLFASLRLASTRFALLRLASQTAETDVATILISCFFGKLQYFFSGKNIILSIFLHK